MAKPELEFFPVTAVGWTPVPGSAGPGLEERVLASDGPIATRILRIAPGTDTTPNGRLRLPPARHGPRPLALAARVHHIRGPLPGLQVTMMTTYQAPPLDGGALRRTMGRFATGVAVITTEHNRQRHGMTVNSLTSVSLDPPMLLVRLARGSRTATTMSRAGRFGVNVLSARQEAISNHFARRGGDHFAEVPLDQGPLGVPLISNAIAQLICTVGREVDAGDHVIVLGNIVHLRHRDGLPLCFFSGTYGDFHDRGNPAEFWYF